MTSNNTLLQKIFLLQKKLLSSMRLKEVLEASTNQFVDLADGSKVALFLADNDSLSFKLVNIYGYNKTTEEQLKVMPFMAESSLKHIVQKKQFFIARNSKEAPDVSASIMERESSKGEIAIPLFSGNLTIGAVLIDVLDSQVLQKIDLLKEIAELTSLSIANAILFGRSEYERERLATLYKTATTLGSSTLSVLEVLQIAADTALILANTPQCAVLTFDKAKQSFNVAAFKGLDGNSFHNFNLSLEGTIAGQSLLSQKTEYVPDTLRYQDYLPKAASGEVLGSAVSVPLIFQDEPLGVLMVFAQNTRYFQREQIDLLDSFSEQVSSALMHALALESASGESIHDAHTGLYNRWHFEEALLREIERSQRHKHDLSLVIIDIDHLSRINDLLGQDKGDLAIKHVASLIKSSLRDIDLSCRFGAEEFAVLLPETQKQAALEVAERLRQRIKTETIPGIGVITVSMGLTSLSDAGKDLASLINAAEQALDIAKYEGRDKVKAAETGSQQTNPIAWNDLAKQAKLAVLSERQSKLENRLTSEYAPWMRTQPGWGARKKTD
jgi:diguanylate cyclase (GGDEF)-like protein